MTQDIRIEDFDYPLPDERIPAHPLDVRDNCKLLLCSPDGRIFHRIFRDLPDLLPPGTLLICNDTKVINARLQFQKESGANIELFLLEPVSPADYALNFQSRENCVWKCLVGNSKKWKRDTISTQVPIEGKGVVELKALRLNILDDGASNISFSWDNPDLTFGQILEYAGRIPIPPYLNRDSEESDNEDYQTVYAKFEGSVAAPTAGLHFTPGVFENLKAHAVEIGKVTLHVGAGTFRPVKSDRIGDHAMHSEPFSITRELIGKILDWKKKGRPVVAVGTTSVRTLESLPYIGHALSAGSADPWHVSQWDPYDATDFDTVEALEKILETMQLEGLDSFTASTSIMIAPGFRWRITDGIVTNFHQPKSTLLLLVSSFLSSGNDNPTDWRILYDSALSNGYRFLSYGDASLLFH